MKNFICTILFTLLCSNSFASLEDLLAIGRDAKLKKNLGSEQIEILDKVYQTKAKRDYLLISKNCRGQVIVYDRILVGKPSCSLSQVKCSPGTKSIIKEVVVDDVLCDHVTKK